MNRSQRKARERAQLPKAPGTKNAPVNGTGRPKGLKHGDSSKTRHKNKKRRN